MRAAALGNGWNENTYKSHEQGIRRGGSLPEHMAAKYARAFRVSQAWLMTGKGHPTKPESDLTPEQLEMAERVIKAINTDD